MPLAPERAAEAEIGATADIAPAADAVNNARRLIFTTGVLVHSARRLK